MSEQPKPRPYLSAAEIAAAPEVHIRHPLNPASDVYLRSLGRPAGLRRTALSLARVPPGRESFIYHSHEHDEEFLFILPAAAGGGIDANHRGRPQGFHGLFPPSSPIIDQSYEQIWSIMGSGKPAATSVFPAGKRVIFDRDRILMMEESALAPVSFEQWLPDGLPEAYRDAAPKKEA
jgi:hypothetical protein